jgi:hypothetical protein
MRRISGAGRRIASLAMGGCLMLGPVIAGCARSAPAGSAAAAAASVTGSPQQRAEAEARYLLGAFVPPPGARRLTRSPDALLASPTTILGSTSLVQRTQWWLASGQPQPLLAWEQQRLPSWLRPGDMDFGPPSWDREWDVTSLPSGLGADLVVKVASAGGGQAGIRVDAQVAWQPPRPATEAVPATATVVTLAEQPSPLRGSQRPPAPVTITAPAVVRRLVALVNGLPLATNAGLPCPAYLGYWVRLTFRTQPGGPPLATVAGPDLNECGDIDFTAAAGRPQNLLTSAGSFLQDVFAAAGLHWPSS